MFRLFVGNVRHCLTVFAFLAVGVVGGQTAYADPPAQVAPLTGQGRVITIACVGDSITAGVGASSSATNYPSLLQDLLGPGFNVVNLGESGATLLKNGDSPYWKRGSFTRVVTVNPDIVVIMLGANDSKPWNWSHSADFTGDYNAFIAYYAALSTHPQIFLCTPCPVPGSGNYGINEPVVEQQITMIGQVAAANHLPIIDVHSGVADNSADFVDNVHPNDMGYVMLASTVYSGLTNAPAILPIANRTVAPSLIVTILAAKAGVNVRYTVDGSTPTNKSPIYLNPITISTPTTVNAKDFRGKKADGQMSSAIFVGAAAVQ